MNVHSIGFTKKKAAEFFALLQNREIETLIDVRLHNVSQLAGFAKRDDLKYFLNEICQIDYSHMPDLAPTKDILDDYKKNKISWDSYEDKFKNLIAKRNIEKLEKSKIENSCLLCSEHLPHHCHRKIVLDYLNDCWGGNLEVTHLY